MIERKVVTNCTPSAPRKYAPKNTGQISGNFLEIPSAGFYHCTLREIASKIGRRHEGMPVGLAGLVVAAREPGASFLRRDFDGGRRAHGPGASAAPRGQDRLDGVLPGLPRRCAARSAEAAHAAASSSDEPPRKPWRDTLAL